MSEKTTQRKNPQDVQPPQRVPDGRSFTPQFERAKEAEGGRPLPGPLRQKMEKGFNADFSQIRIFEDDLPQQYQADAVAYGETIHVRPGQIRPGTPAGELLLGHEVVHTLQQRAGKVKPGRRGLNQDEPLETEASELSGQVLSGQTGVRLPASGEGRPVVQAATLEELLQKEIKRRERKQARAQTGRAILQGGEAIEQKVGTAKNLVSSVKDVSAEGDISQTIKTMTHGVEPLPAPGKEVEEGGVIPSLELATEIGETAMTPFKLAGAYRKSKEARELQKTGDAFQRELGAHREKEAEKEGVFALADMGGNIAKFADSGFGAGFEAPLKIAKSGHDLVEHAGAAHRARIGREKMIALKQGLGEGSALHGAAAYVQNTQGHNVFRKGAAAATDVLDIAGEGTSFAGNFDPTGTTKAVGTGLKAASAAVKAITKAATKAVDTYQAHNIHKARTSAESYAPTAGDREAKRAALRIDPRMALTTVHRKAHEGSGEEKEAAIEIFRSGIGGGEEAVETLSQGGKLSTFEELAAAKLERSVNPNTITQDLASAHQSVKAGASKLVPKRLKQKSARKQQEKQQQAENARLEAVQLARIQAAQMQISGPHGGTRTANPFAAQYQAIARARAEEKQLAQRGATQADLDAVWEQEFAEGSDLYAFRPDRTIADLRDYDTNMDYRAERLEAELGDKFGELGEEDTKRRAERLRIRKWKKRVGEEV